MPKGKPGTKKPSPQDFRETPAKGKPLDGSKNPGGRPTEWNEDAINALADEMERFYALDSMAMLLEDFCAHRKIPLEYMSRFAEKNEKFNQVKQVTESLLTSRIFKAAGLGVIHPTIGIFGLKNSGTKWRDKHDVTHAGEIEQKHTGTVTVAIDTTKIADLLNGTGG